MLKPTNTMATTDVGKIPLAIVSEGSVADIMTEGNGLDEILVQPEKAANVPGYFGEVKRAESITVKGRDQQSKEIRIKADEFLAQVLEHEIDHLNGTLYIDRLEGKDKFHKIEPEELQL